MCQWFGQILRTYRRSVQTGSICAQVHDWTVRPTPNLIRFANCEAFHADVDNSCPVRTTATKKKKTVVNGSAVLPTPSHEANDFLREELNRPDVYASRGR